MVFTPEELRRECRPLSELAVEALDAGRLDELRHILGRMSAGHFELFWGYLHWVVRLAGKVLRDFGEPFFEETSSKIAASLMSPYARWILEGRDKDAVSAIVLLWVSQKGRVRALEETANEVGFLLHPCGSGGRLLLEAWHENAPTTYPRTRGGSPLFCRLCEHLRHALNQAVGSPFWSVEPVAGRSGFCRWRFRKRDARGRPWYAAEELDRLTSPRCRLALRLLDQGNPRIHDLLRDQHHEWRPLHDFLCLWVTSLLSLIYPAKGSAYLSDLVWDTYVTLFESAYVLHALLDDRTVFRNLVRNWHYHQARFSVQEEEGRFVFTLDPCGSGGRLCRGEMGPPGSFRYGQGLLREITEPSDLTFGRAPFPVYCTHCAATNRDQLLGKPWPFLVDGDALLRPDSACRQVLYKKTAARRAPPELLRQVGLDAAMPLRKEYLP